MQASAAAAAAAAAKAAAAECGTVILQPPSISPALPLTAATPPSFTGQDIFPISSTPLQPSLHSTAAAALACTRLGLEQLEMPPTRYDCIYFLQHFCIFLQLTCDFFKTPHPIFLQLFLSSERVQFGARSLLCTRVRPFGRYKRSYQPAHTSPAVCWQCEVWTSTYITVQFCRHYPVWCPKSRFAFHILEYLLETRVCC